MLKENLNDFLFFMVLAREGSFTKASAILGMSQSALSHAIKALEHRLQLRLFNRTTRSVSLTDAGERLLQMVEPKFSTLEDELHELSEDYNKPTGSIRISSPDYASQHIVWPAVKRFAKAYPDINVEINIENRMTDIVAERYDAGVRLGDQVAKDMVAVRISADMRLLVVCSPSYLADKSMPSEPDDLTSHECINLRLNTNGGLYAWEFEKQGKVAKVRVKGQLAFNTTNQMLEAALDSFGFAYLPDDLVKTHIESGRLICVLDDWCPVNTGFHLYYPSRRQHKVAFTLFVDALRYKS